MGRLKYNLSVAVLPMDEFPTGPMFWFKTQYMQDVLERRKRISIFHMSWTYTKDTKQGCLQSLGWWFLDDACTGDALHAGCCRAPAWNATHSMVGSYLAFKKDQ